MLCNIQSEVTTICKEKMNDTNVTVKEISSQIFQTDTRDVVVCYYFITPCCMRQIIHTFVV